MNDLSVSIVIPNWNGEKLLEKNLPSVVAVSYEAAEIVVADDASTDGSVPFLKNKFPKVKLVQSTKRRGYSGNVNLGVGVAKSDIVVLINTDVVPEKGYLKPLLSHFDDPGVFAVGCEDRSMENGLTVLRGRGEAAWIKGFFVHWRGEVNKSDTFWVSGGSGAFRKKTWDKLGGMDPLFNPFYWEDIDLGYRALKSGYKLVFEPKSRVNHFHEEGKILREYTQAQIERTAYRNQFIFIWKNLSDYKIFLQHIVWTPVRLMQSLITGNLNMLTGYIMAVLLLPKIVNSRQKISVLWQKKDNEIIAL